MPLCSGRYILCRFKDVINTRLNPAVNIIQNKIKILTIKLFKGMLNEAFY
jgi:hypothetical protein